MSTNANQVNVQGLDFDTAWNRIFPYTFHKLKLAADIDGEYQSLSNSAVVFRSDGLELKPVGSDFEIVQPDEIKETFRPLIDSGKVELASGSGLKNGSAMIAYGVIKDAIAEVVPKDFVRAEFRMYSGFDGGLSIGGSLGVKQMRCSNTLPIAIRGQVEQTVRMMREAMDYPGFRFKHTKHVRVRLADANTEVARATKAFFDTVETFKVIASKKVTAQQLKAYVRNVFETVEPLKEGEERSAKFHTRTNRLVELLDIQRGGELVPAMRGTLWQGYSAITEYLTHEAGRNDDSRLNSNLFGQNAKISRTALNLALAH